MRFFRGNIINNFERIKAYYNENGIRYTDLSDSGKNVLRLRYNAENMSGVEAYVIFDEDLSSAHIVCTNIANFKGKETTAMRVCNDVHKRFRWVCFTVDSDSDIRAEVDIMLDPRDCGYVCRYAVSQLCNIVDDAYPEFMKGRWA